MTFKDKQVNYCVRAIYSGDLSADQLAATFYNRGFEYTKKGDYEQAIADFDKAIDLRPKFIQAFNSRAAIHIELGLDELAFADVDEAIEITPDHAGLYRHRAKLQFRRGAFAAALPDLWMAARLSVDDAQTALWLHFVESRSGLGDGQTLRRFAVNRNLSEWPGPAVAMFLGITSAQAIADIGYDAARQGRARRECQAYFYVGQYQLLRGARDNAAVFFRAAMATGASGVMEYTGALAELARLGG